MLFYTACSAETPAASSLPPPGNDLPSTAPTKAAGSGLLQAGEYITEKGWGHLQLSKRGDTLKFSLESITGEDTCGLDGAIQGDEGIAKSDNGESTCTVKFANTPQGIDVSATTTAECKAFCGYNGNFEGSYLRVKEGCGRSDLDQTRDAFQQLYNSKDYKTALATLSPALANCLPTLEWEEEGAIRNDLAITQYKNGLYAECLATLDKYAEDADKNDDAVIDGWTPVLADRYLAIVRAARTNIGLCGKGQTSHQESEQKAERADWPQTKIAQRDFSVAAIFIDRRSRPWKLWMISRKDRESAKAMEFFTGELVSNVRIEAGTSGANSPKGISNIEYFSFTDAKGHSYSSIRATPSSVEIEQPSVYAGWERNGRGHEVVLGGYLFENKGSHSQDHIYSTKAVSADPSIFFNGQSACQSVAYIVQTQGSRLEESDANFTERTKIIADYDAEKGCWNTRPFHALDLQDNTFLLTTASRAFRINSYDLTPVGAAPDIQIIDIKDK
ncbi:hypothetical protein ACCQ13_01980 [Xanthomonas sp. NCPPB 1638]|uniref:hypothetical protein n=1 Tax=Xanthomonas TaxID=338 RepID=UPI002011432F|nr:hypothetical protein [Xanthomonas cucurbitae]